jgi:small conductance mechanosensitive channel
MIYFQNVMSWLGSGGLRVVIILVIAWLVIRIIRFAVTRAVKVFIDKGEEVLGNGVVKEQRIKTLSKVFKSTISVVIWTIAILTILPELGVNITPLLAGAGIVALAVGMGAKNLIQDYLSGLFILLEDHYRVGEEVEINEKKGVIKDLNLRRTVVRSEDGTNHYISNGQIKAASNFSRK